MGEALSGAELILLLVRHTVFLNLQPQEVAELTPARVVVDTVNAWERQNWEKAGFQFFRLGDGRR